MTIAFKVVPSVVVTDPCLVPARSAPIRRRGGRQIGLDERVGRHCSRRFHSQTWLFTYEKRALAALGLDGASTPAGTAVKPADGAAEVPELSVVMEVALRRGESARRAPMLMPHQARGSRPPNALHRARAVPL